MRSSYKHLIIYLTAVFLACTDAHASMPGNTGAIHYNLKIHVGRMMPHNIMLDTLNQDQIRGFEVNAWFGEAVSESLARPNLGAGYFFSNLGNHEVLGNIHSFYMSVLYPVYRGSFSVEFKSNLGIGYATKPYDPERNPYNRAVGSHLNFYGQVSFTGRVPLGGSRWVFRPGISFNHVSNGTVVAPNAGLNTLTFHAGFDFRSGHAYPERLRLEEKPYFNKQNRFAVFYAAGIKQVDVWMENKIFTSSLVLDYGFRLLSSFSIGAGMGFFYNESWAYRASNNGNNSISPFQAAIHLSLQKDTGPLSFFVHPGTYIYLPAEEAIPYFTGRLGMRYKFVNNLTLQFAIKHHWFAIADYFEWGIGYEFSW